MNSLPYSANDDNFSGFNFEALERDAAFLTLTGMLADLKAAEYSDQDIYQLFQAEPEKLPYRLTDEEMEQFTKSLNLQPPEAPPDQVKLLRQAIDTQDKAAFLTDGNITLLATMKRLNPLNYAVAIDQIKQAFGKSINMRDLNRSISHAERNQALADGGEKPDVADVAYSWVITHRDLWAFDEARQCWRMYNGEYWQEQADKASFLDQYAVAALQEAEIQVNSSQALNLFQCVAASHCKRKFEHAPNKINFSNGTLDLKTMQLGPFRQEDNFTYCLSYSHEPYGKHPTIDSFLWGSIGEIHDGQFVPNVYAIQACMAHVGLALMEDRAIHKALIGLGLPGSGKSTLLDVFNMVCGLKPKKYVSDSVFDRELEGKRARYLFNSRLIASIDEVPSDAFQDEELVKQMIAHSGVSIRGLHKDEQEDNSW